MVMFLYFICWLAQPLFKGHLYSRDTCLGPEGVSWIEVPLYLFQLYKVYLCILPNFLKAGKRIFFFLFHELKKKNANIFVRDKHPPSPQKQNKKC